MNGEKYKLPIQILRSGKSIRDTVTICKNRGFKISYVTAERLYKEFIKPYKDSNYENDPNNVEFGDQPWNRS